MPDPNSPVATLDYGTSRGDDAITVYFVPNGQQANAIPDEVTSDGWTQFEIDRFMAALTTISNYINVTFEQSNNPNADFQMVLDDDELGSRGLLGYFYLPPFTGYTGQQMGVFNADGYGWDSNGLQPGGLGFSTIIHEVLHGLGLDHPHEGDAVLAGLDEGATDFPFGVYGDFGLNQTVFTIMSYNGGYNGNPSNSFNYGDAMGPMALDIAMLQELYGANTTHNSGNNTYVLPDTNAANSGTGWLAIWDTGGTDTIRYDGSRNVTIDLRPATLQYEEGGGGFISAANGIAGGFTIANGVIIENAIGGSGHDLLVGNDVANTLTGNGGTDFLFGGGGNDSLYGGNGNDTIFGGTGHDYIDGGANNDTLHGNSGSDTIITSSGTNLIYGSSGADTITGGGGSDTIYGNSGNDTINGGGGSDTIYGGRGNDVLNGGNGNDILNGGMGQDTLTGGAGADTFVFDFVSDSWASRPDTITDFVSGTDRIDLSGIDADLATQGDDAFEIVTAFTENAGQIVLATSGGNTTVQIDRDGDGVAEMAILVAGVTNLTESDFFL